MNKNILIKILQLDSLVNVLTWYERVLIHQILNDKETSATQKIIDLYSWIVEENWESPKREYQHDRVLHFYDPDAEMWVPDEYYLKINKTYAPWINQLKANYRK
ncbi:hypothetical protein [Chryseobacterium salviniae]|uniref:Uncharacterized protein n=1 Tax=Chryseobacterium salviniae TaxID=3101750 RepID=A0ABU6HU14_9FLAO|nr:hypothetical protein [Chryseobacterium sp. T9W2-O]MEC3875967.1 hypothetical protein [Chryseobacterium sp. T9W2-O]